MWSWPQPNAGHRQNLGREDKSLPMMVQLKSGVTKRAVQGYAIRFWRFAGIAAAMSMLACSGSSTANTLTSIAVTPVSPSIAVGATLQFSAAGTYGDGSTRSLTNASWSSSATDAATISATGLATAIAPGTTSITASSEGVSGTTSLSVEVERNLVSIAVGPANPSIVVGNTVQLNAIGTFNDGSVEILTNSVMWSSTDPAVASINAEGLVTGNAPGTIVIIASSGIINGSMSITVTQN